MTLRSYAQARLAIVGRPGPGKVVDPWREACARTAADRSRMLETEGWRCLPWRPTSPGSPCVQRTRCAPDWDRTLTTGWFDHPYRLVNRSEGRTLFCAEPYDISDDALAALNELRRQGWSVTIRADGATWFPGHTVLVCIERRAAVKRGAA